MAPRREASIASSKPPNYNPRDLCHPEEIEAIEAECEEDDKQVENQDLEDGGSEFSPSQVSSQETDFTSSQNTVHSQSDDSDDAESQRTCSQSSCHYEDDDAGDDFAEYQPPQVSQPTITLAAEAGVDNFVFDELLIESKSSSPFHPNFLDSNDQEASRKADAVASG